jgi:hypothetical protein
VIGVCVERERGVVGEEVGDDVGLVEARVFRLNMEDEILVLYVVVEAHLGAGVDTGVLTRARRTSR